MTEEERKLLLAVARWVAKREQEEAERLDISSPMLNELRRLINAAAESRPAEGRPKEPSLSAARHGELRRPEPSLLLAKLR